MSIDQKLMFFAYKGRYEGQADDNVDSIKHAITTYNQHQKGYIAKSWEEFKKTTPISHEILNAIDSCEVFVCDLTYFNHNVLFELGYAMAKDKHILILLNERIENAKTTYQEFILKDIRYTPITNFRCILGALQQKNFKKDLIRQFVNLENIQEKSIDVFYIQSSIPSQASLELTQAITDYCDRRICNLIGADPSEIVYKPLNWYFQNLVKSKAVIIHFLGKNIEKEFVENAKNSFYAGIGCGLGHDVLLFAPSKFKAPLDYYEILTQYTSSDEIKTYVERWLGERIRYIEPAEELEKKGREYNLIKLGIGCDIAEHEKEGLLHYFVETASYYAALNQEKSLLLGRKGSGKSAIYIKLLNTLPSDKINLVVSLKPESDELLEDVEMSKFFDTKVSQKKFFFTVWREVIYSKIIGLVYDELLKRPTGVGYSQPEERLIDFVENNEAFLKLNFLGVVEEISRKIKGTSNIESADILRATHAQYLTPLITHLKEYFDSIRKKYFTIVILADSLDKTWESQHNLDIQSEMILTLLEIDEKIKQDLISKERTRVNVKQIIFLRKDIFDYIRNVATEPDKLTTMSHEIQWENYPNLLRDLINNRFKHILGLNSDTEVEDKAWHDFFDIKDKSKRHPYDIIRDIITCRPRDLIYFISRLFESAINKGHSKVNQEDLHYAIVSYTAFLNNNLIAETRAEFPEIPNILAKLQEHHGEKIEYRKFCRIVRSFSYDQKKLEKLIATFFDKGYMLGYDDKTGKPFSDLDILKKKLEERRFFFLHNKVYVIAHAKYYFIKHKAFSSF